MRKEVTQYTLLVAILALLIYIAVVTTGSITTTIIQDENSIDEIQDSNLATYELVSGNLDYVHTADMNRATK